MTLYGVWQYHNNSRAWLEGAGTDIDTLREQSNAHQAKLKSEGHRGCHFFEKGEMKSSVFSYFNGERMWSGWLQIEPLPNYNDKE